jgi:hypothetical protein
MRQEENYTENVCLIESLVFASAQKALLSLRVKTNKAKKPPRAESVAIFLELL